MRFAHPSPLSHLTLFVCVVTSLVAGGCGYEHGFLNPGDVGRYKREPLLKPILSTLDTGYEEPDDQFTQAIDVEPEDLTVAEQDYTVGKNDLLTISISDLIGPGAETIKSVRVSESGNISLPLIGQLRTEGLTEQQLEAEIQRAYREADLIPKAQVSVTVAQALGRTFSIRGTVQRPGQYQITQSDFRILDALVASGDISSQGVDYLYVVRRKDLSAGPRPGATAPAAAPQPGTTPPAPPSDILQPRSQAPNTTGEWWNEQPVYLQQSAPAGAAPGAAPGAPPIDSGDGKYIIIDNKPVLVGNQGATVGAAVQAPAGAEGAAAAPATPADVTPPVEPATPPAAPADAAPAAAPAADLPAVAPAPDAPLANTPAAAEPVAPAAAATQAFEFQNPMSGENIRVIRVPIQPLNNGDLRYNIVIRPQDMIIAPQPVTGEYYIDGHVNRTGVYNLTARKITLQQAIAAAGGYDQLAFPMRTEIIRRIGEDRQVYASVNLDKISSGAQPDIYLKPNDIVRVGTNVIAPFVAAFRNAFRVTYGFGFLYDRNYAPQQARQDGI